jgi:hypothetical protein
VKVGDAGGQARVGRRAQGPRAPGSAVPGRTVSNLAPERARRFLSGATPSAGRSSSPAPRGARPARALAGPPGPGSS